MKKVTAKILMLFLGVLMLSSMVATGSNNSVTSGIETNEDPLKIAIVYSTGGLGDLSFNDAAQRGINASKAAFGALIDVEEACGATKCTNPDVTKAIKDQADKEEFDLIIGIGFTAFEGVNSSAYDYPDTKFAIVDENITKSNVQSFVYKEEESGFLAGLMAGMTTKTNKVGFLGGLPIPLIDRFGAGFVAGAQYVNENVTAQYTYAPNPDDPWGDTDAGARTADKFIEEGADIIFVAAGGTGIGAINAIADHNAEATDKVYAVGVDSNQDGISEGNVLTSALKDVSKAVNATIAELVADTWAGEVKHVGYAEGYVDLTDMEFTKDIRDGTYNKPGSEYDGMKRIDVVNAIKVDLAAGDIDIPKVFGDLDGVEEVTIDLSGGFLPLPIVPMLFGVFITAVIIRRRK